MAGLHKRTGSDKLRKTKLSMIVGFTFIIVVSTIFMSMLSLQKTYVVMEEKVKDMTSALSMQLKINIDNYLSKLETTGTLIFATEEVYEYDAVNPGIDEYEALNTESIISDKLMELCIMENYVDFGIVYSNNHSVGKVSNGTSSLFGNDLYSSLESIISRKRTSDGWATGCREDYKRIYYVKRINENTVFVASFYTTELKNVFELPDTMNDMTVRLVNENNNVVYSTIDDETGTSLPYIIGNTVEGLNSAAVIDNEHLVTVDRCGDKWRVICSVPRAIILRELHDIQNSTMLITVIGATIAIALAVFLAIKVTAPMDTLVNDLGSKAYIDVLTGVGNKRSFEEDAKNALYKKKENETAIMFVIDVDNFKGVNDTLGHSYGDKVLAKIGAILRDTFRSTDILGRIGGDEFAVFTTVPKQYNNNSSIINSRCEALCEAFRNNYTGNDNMYKVSCSIGVAFSEEDCSYSELFLKADRALYTSKSRGKDTYTVYKEAYEEAGESNEK